jgi:hypothetical protein
VYTIFSVWFIYLDKKVVKRQVVVMSTSIFDQVRGNDKNDSMSLTPTSASASASAKTISRMIDLCSESNNLIAKKMNEQDEKLKILNEHSIQSFIQLLNEAKNMSSSLSSSIDGINESDLDKGRQKFLRHLDSSLTSVKEIISFDSVLTKKMDEAQLPLFMSQVEHRLAPTVSKKLLTGLTLVGGRKRKTGDITSGDSEDTSHDTEEKQTKQLKTSTKGKGKESKVKFVKKDYKFNLSFTLPTKKNQNFLVEYVNKGEPVSEPPVALVIFKHGPFTLRGKSGNTNILHDGYHYCELTSIKSTVSSSSSPVLFDDPILTDEDVGIDDDEETDDEKEEKEEKEEKSTTVNATVDILGNGSNIVQVIGVIPTNIMLTKVRIFPIWKNGPLKYIPPFEDVEIGQGSGKKANKSTSITVGGNIHRLKEHVGDADTNSETSDTQFSTVEDAKRYLRPLSKMIKLDRQSTKKVDVYEDLSKFSELMIALVANEQN